jgi:hypothetical protein
MSSAKFELRQIAGKLLQLSNKLDKKTDKVEYQKMGGKKNGGKTKKVNMKERMRLMREMRGKTKTQKMKFMKENNWKGGDTDPVANTAVNDTVADTGSTGNTGSTGDADVDVVNTVADTDADVVDTVADTDVVADTVANNTVVSHPRSSMANNNIPPSNMGGKKKREKKEKR